MAGQERSRRVPTAGQPRQATSPQRTTVLPASSDVTVRSPASGARRRGRHRLVGDWRDLGDRDAGPWPEELVEVANVVSLHDQERGVLREREPVAEDLDVLASLVEQRLRAALPIRTVPRLVRLLDVEEHSSDLPLRGVFANDCRALPRTMIVPSVRAVVATNSRSARRSSVSALRR